MHIALQRLRITPRCRQPQIPYRWPRTAGSDRFRPRPLWANAASGLTCGPGPPSLTRTLPLPDRPSAGPRQISRFFFVPAHSFFPLLGLLVELVVFVEGCDPQTCKFGLLGCRVKPSARNDLQEREERKQNVAGEGKTARNVGLRGPTNWGPFFWVLTNVFWITTVIFIVIINLITVN